MNEKATIISQSACPGRHFILRLHAPYIATNASAGNNVHLDISAKKLDLAIMRSEPLSGHIDVLYQTLCSATQSLAELKVGDTLTLEGPKGQTFSLNPKRPRPLLIGSDQGLAAVIFLASIIHRTKDKYFPLMLLSSEAPFPFTPSPSRTIIPGMPNGTIASLPLMEDWRIPTRLASLQGLPGCFDGPIDELAEHWLNSLSAQQLSQIDVFISGPPQTIVSLIKLSKKFDLPCQACSN